MYKLYHCCLPHIMTCHTKTTIQLNQMHPQSEPQFPFSSIYTPSDPGSEANEASEAPIFYLPECLHRAVYSYLPLLDKACLSVTCKLFHTLFGTVLKRRELRYPRPPRRDMKTRYKIGHEMIAEFSASTWRREFNRDHELRFPLLLRLEDARWAPCYACMMLQPRERWRFADQPWGEIRVARDPDLRSFEWSTRLHYSHRWSSRRMLGRFDRLESLLFERSYPSFDYHKKPEERWTVMCEHS
ncbi:hypothetical protein BDW74DRAFT_9067 [Aspergillus multicolor]|uniref:uncharacterized protein n=1 Tax=Aspergillus multicolor TaxID=41759 RepID=UPI003CCD7784